MHYKSLDNRLAIPVKGSEVWVIKTGKPFIRYSTGRIDESGNLIVSNFKGNKQAVAKNWSIAPRKVYHKGPFKGQVVRVLPVRGSMKGYIEVMFKEPVKVFGENVISVYEGSAEDTFSKDFTVILPKMIPTILL